MNKGIKKIIKNDKKKFNDSVIVNFVIISFNKNMVENKGFDSGTHETLQNKVPWFNYPFDSKTFELNQKYIKHFEKIHIFNTRKLIKSILSFSLYKLGYVRLRKGIKRTKYLIDALNH